MAASYDSPTEYIQHHLTFFTRPVKEGPFWMVNVDTMLTTIVLGALAFGFMWLVTRKASQGVPSKTQAFVELSIDFVNDQVKSIYNGTSRIVAPIALTTFVLVLFMNAMDFLPVDIMSSAFSMLGFHEFRMVPTADVNTTFALSLSVLGLMIFYNIKNKGLGGWVHELYAVPFGVRPLWAAPLLIAFNLLFNVIEYVSKPLSHSLRLFGNMYAGEIMFLLIALLASSGYLGMFGGALAQVAWIGFDGFIAILQAYIFMMLTVAYIAMAHEHH